MGEADEVALAMKEKLWHAMKDGKVEDVQALLSASPALLKADLGFSNTPIKAAAYLCQGNYDVVIALLNAGAGPDDRTGTSEAHWTALHYAVKHNRQDLAKILLERGADPNLKWNGLDARALATTPEMKSLFPEPEPVSVESGRALSTASVGSTTVRSAIHSSTVDTGDVPMEASASADTVEPSQPAAAAEVALARGAFTGAPTEISADPTAPSLDPDSQSGCDAGTAEALTSENVDTGAMCEDAKVGSEADASAASSTTDVAPAVTPEVISTEAIPKADSAITSSAMEVDEGDGYIQVVAETDGIASSGPIEDDGLLHSGPPTSQPEINPSQMDCTA